MFGGSGLRVRVRMAGSSRSLNNVGPLRGFTGILWRVCRGVSGPGGKPEC